MFSRFIGSLIVSALVFAAAIFMWRSGEELWNSRHPVEEGYALYHADDHLRAHPILRHYATWGDPRAQTYLSEQYRHGNGTFQSSWLAGVWMERAADQNYSDALALLGIRYHFGYGVEKNLLQARDYYLAAADLGHPEGFAGLAYLHVFDEFLYRLDLEHEAIRAGTQSPKPNFGIYLRSDMAEYQRLMDLLDTEDEAFARQTRELLDQAIAGGSVWAQATFCHEQIRFIPDPDFSEIDPATMGHCVEGGLGGYKGSLARAVSLLSHAKSPFRDLEKAYEYAVISKGWWPAYWSHPEYDPIAVFFVGAMEGSPSLWENCQDIIYDVISRAERSIAYPSAELAPPKPGRPKCRLLIDEGAMLRAEANATAYLVDHPLPGRLSWVR